MRQTAHREQQLSLFEYYGLLPRIKKAGTKMLPTRIISRLRPVMKISLGFAQVVGLISQVYQIEYPPEFDLFVSKFYMPFNINIFAAIPMQCFKWRTLSTCPSPVLFALAAPALFKFTHPAFSQTTTKSSYLRV